MKKLVNISIDDVSPHPLSSTKVLNQCYELIKTFPEIKFTLFIPVAYWRTMKAIAASPGPFYISEHPKFCEEIKNLPKENFEIAYHGYHHGIPGQSDNDEFRNLNHDQALEVYDKMFQEVSTAGMQNIFRKILRPPAWRMSPDAIRAAKEFGFDILALSPDKYLDGSLDYKGEDKNFGNVVYYNVAPPFKDLQLFDKTEIVYHACEWDRNYLNKEKTDNLTKFLQNNLDEVQFCFMEEM